MLVVMECVMFGLGKRFSGDAMRYAGLGKRFSGDAMPLAYQ